MVPIRSVHTQNQHCLHEGGEQVTAGEKHTAFYVSVFDFFKFTFIIINFQFPQILQIFVFFHLEILPKKETKVLLTLWNL